MAREIGETEVAISIVTLIELATEPLVPIRRRAKTSGCNSLRSCCWRFPSTPLPFRWHFAPVKLMAKVRPAESEFLFPIY